MDHPNLGGHYYSRCSTFPFGRQVGLVGWLGLLWPEPVHAIAQCLDIDPSPA